jgi:hypothetical protein
MPVNFVDGFMANMRDKGFARANRYLVLIQPNPTVAASLGYSSEEIKQRLSMTNLAVTLPQKSFLTHEVNITQPTQYVPYGINSNNSAGVSFEFYVLGDMFEKNVFEMWQNLIIDPVTKQQSYYNDFAKGSSIIIVELPNIVPSFEAALESITSQDLVSGIRLTEIYPYNFTVNGGAQSYASSTEPLKVKVDFMYREIGRINEPKIRGIDSAMRIVDENGNFTRQTVRETAESILSRAELLRNINQTYSRSDVVQATLQDAQNDFKESQKRESKTSLEKAYSRQKYNQSQNVPRGVDGRLINPKVDGLPNTNPNDEISQLLTKGLAFISQGQGFLGWYSGNF